MKYVVKKTAMYGSSTYGPYGSYQEALEASKELAENSFGESFFTVERVKEKNKPKTIIIFPSSTSFESGAIAMTIPCNNTKMPTRPKKRAMDFFNL